MDFDYDHERQKKAQEIKDALGPLLGKKPQRHADALALAIQQMSPALWQSLADMLVGGEDEEATEGTEY